MSAPTKRRHVSYYLSLPLVVAIVFLVVARLAALQRADMVADLADRIAHQEADEATAALRHLAAMPRPPIDILVAAATSPDQVIADEAQHLISDLLRRWQRQIESGRRVSTVARQLGELADALAQREMAFSTSDHTWVRNTARKILRLANRMPANKSPLVAANCDTVLASVAASEMSAATFIDRQVAAVSQPVTPLPGTAQSAPATDEFERELAAFAVQPFVSGGGDSVRGSQTSDDAEPMAPAAIPTDESAIPDEESQARRILKWMHPMLRIAPAMPINAAPEAGSWNRAEAESERSGGSLMLDPRHPRLDDSDAREVERPGGSLSLEASHPRLDPGHPRAPAQPSVDDHALSDVESRELLQRWLHADGGDVYPLEEELTERGFGRLSARLVERLFSEDAAERLQLVDDVLTEPGVDVRPWLLLLAEDFDADVRLLAVTIMATSDDGTLIEKAWHVAIHDRDPRIAGLASRLRERREAVQRR